MSRLGTSVPGIIINNPIATLMRTSVNLLTKQIYNPGIVKCNPSCIYSPHVHKRDAFILLRVHLWFRINFFILQRNHKMFTFRITLRLLQFTDFSRMYILQVHQISQIHIIVYYLSVYIGPMILGITVITRL